MSGLLLLFVVLSDPTPLWDREYSRESVSWILLDGPTVVSERWGDAARGIAAGSLVKPFLAVAYGESHGGQFPKVNCAPGKCWLPRGHGQVGIREAMAQSCNEYARALARQLQPEALHAVLDRFSMPHPPDQRSWTGESRSWRIAPHVLARAYAELAALSHDRSAAVLDGLRAAAASGTARAVGGDAMAKTGTAPCLSESPHDGDGFAVVIAPRENPRFVLLVRQHNVPGSKAAATAGRMMRTFREGR